MVMVAIDRTRKTDAAVSDGGTGKIGSMRRIAPGDGEEECQEKQREGGSRYNKIADSSEV